MLRSRLIPALLIAATSAVPDAALGQRQPLRSSDSLFDLSRRAVVFTETSLFREQDELFDLDLEAALAESWLPFDLISLSKNPRQPSTFELRYSFVLMNPVEFVGSAFADRMTVQGHLFELNLASETKVDLGPLTGVPLQFGGGARALFSRATSQTAPDLSGSFDFEDSLDPFVYGNEVLGTVHAFARLGSFLRWQSRLFFQRRRSVDPSQVSLDGRGVLSFPARDDQTGLSVALFDEFEILGIGLAGEVQHGASLWNFKEMLMAGVKEKVLIPSARMTVEAGVKGFDGFSTNMAELNLGYVPDMELAITGGGRLGFDGRVYSARVGVAYHWVKAEGTVQLVNRRGEPDRLFGVGVGASLRGLMEKEKGDRSGLDGELAIYYNYLDHLDQVPELRDTFLIMGRVFFDSGPSEP